MSRVLAGLAAISIVLTIGAAVRVFRGEPVFQPSAPADESVTAPAADTSARADGYAATDASEAERAGQHAYARGDIAGALLEFQTAAAANPQDPRALNNLAQALVRDGRAPDAIDYFNRAIALAPDSWAYHFNRARAFAQMQDWNRAVAGYRNAATLFPGDYVTEFNLAKALQASGDLAGAIAGFERAIALAPGQADFHRSHAIALEAAGRPRDAAAAYREYLAGDPNASDADQVKARIQRLEDAPAATRSPAAS